MGVKKFLVSMLYGEELGEINQLIKDLKSRCEQYHEANTKWKKMCEEQLAHIEYLNQQLSTANKKVAFYKEAVAELANALISHRASPIANDTDVEYPTPVQSENETLPVAKEPINADSNSNS